MISTINGDDMRFFIFSAIILIGNVIVHAKPRDEIVTFDETASIGSCFADFFNSFEKEKNQAVRVKMAEFISEKIAAAKLSNACFREDYLVRNLSKMLNDENRGVRLFSLVSLGSLGKKALSAMGELEKAIEKIRIEDQRFIPRTGSSLLLKVHIAIYKISGRPIPKEFTDPEYYKAMKSKENRDRQKCQNRAPMLPDIQC